MAKYKGMKAGTKLIVTSRLKTEDDRGFKMETPIVEVSINGSEYLNSDSVINGVNSAINYQLSINA